MTTQRKTLNRQPRCKIEIKFAKCGSMKFISHLDLVNLFQRAARRAGIPVFLSSGFTPRPKISFKRALKLGLESYEEEAVFSLNKEISPSLVKKNLQKQLPEGIEIKEARFV